LADHATVRIIDRVSTSDKNALREPDNQLL
jgi:hypothetical protein